MSKSPIYHLFGIYFGIPCPNKIIYIKRIADMSILLFSAIAGSCPSINTIKMYNNSPNIMECSIIVRPASILFVYMINRKNIYDIMPII
jgi:hypothetical protein